MKFLFPLLLLLALPAKGQEWHPVGTTWYYTQLGLFGNEHFVQFEITRSDTIGGKYCNIIETAGSNEARYYVYADSSCVYAYHPFDSVFLPLYNFDLEVGDTMIYYRIPSTPIPYKDSIRMVLDSIGTEVVDGKTLEVQYFKKWMFGIADWGTKIYRDIGNFLYLFPFHGFVDPSPGPIRCFLHPTHPDSSVHFVNHACDLVPVQEISEQLPLGLSPNPTSEQLRVVWYKPLEGRLVLADLHGRPVLERQIGVGQRKVELWVADLPKGVYILCLQTRQGGIVAKKLVISR